MPTGAGRRPIDCAPLAEGGRIGTDSAIELARFGGLPQDGERPASSRLEIASEYHRCGIEGSSSRHWHLVLGLEHEFVHDA